MTLKNIITFFTLFILAIGSAFAALERVSAPSDQQITKIITTNNDGEIALAQLAEKKAENKKVKKFAKEMVKDHSKNNKKTMKISKRLDMAPEDNARASQIKSEGDKQMAELQNLSGKDFDKAYMNMQVQAHQKTLNELDTTLIPSVKNEKLKKQLEKTRKSVAEHLEVAKEISTKL